MEKSSFFNAQLTGNTYDRVYKAEDIANYFSTFIGNGVFANPTNSLQVISEEGTPTKFGMPIIVKKGKAFINGYFYENTDNLTLYVNTANGTLKRIDRVVVRLDFLKREIKAYILEGTPSANPIAPNITRDADYYELVLADITVDKGVSFIAQANIVDKRQDSSFCGIVKGTIEQIDTTDLFNQFTDTFNTMQLEEREAFESWFNHLKSQLDENQATNLQNQIDALNDTKVEYRNFRLNGGSLSSATVGDNGSFYIQADKGKGIVLGTKYDTTEGVEKDSAIVLTNDEGNSPVLRPTGATGGGVIGIGTEVLPFKNVMTENGVSATKENSNYKDYFYFNVEQSGNSDRFNGTIGLRHYEATSSETSYMGLNFNKYSTINNITPFHDLATDLGTQLLRFRNIYCGGFNRGKNGYSMLPNGLILQWGEHFANITDQSTFSIEITIKFPIQFPKANLQVVPSLQLRFDNGDWATLQSALFQTAIYKDSVSYKLTFTGNGSGRTRDYRLIWYAIGY